MANTFKLKTSSVSGRIPTTSDLQISELAYNSFDGKLYAKRNNGTESIIEIGASAGGATNLDGLSDVAITSAAKGQFLAHNGTQFVNTRTLEADLATTIPLTIQGAPSHSNYLFRALNSAGTHLVAIVGSGDSYFTTDTASKPVLVCSRPASPTNYGFVVRHPNGKRMFGVGSNASVFGDFAGWGSTIELGTDDYQLVRLGYHTATGALRLWSNTDTIQSWESPGGAAGTYFLTLARNTTTSSWNYSLSGSVTSVRFETTLHANRFVEKSANAFNTSLAPASGTLTVDTSSGNAVLGALSASVTTWAFTNVPTDNSKVTKVTAVIAGNTSYTYGDACSVNGTAITGGVQWSGGSAPASTSGTDIVTFIIARDSAGTIKVFGDAVTNFS
jgi:hypothetical protein